MTLQGSLSDDYIKDGMLYCGKCNTPKQIRLSVFGGPERIVSCLCECGMKEREKEREEREREDRRRDLERRRDVGFPDDVYRDCNFDKDDLAHPDVTLRCKGFVEHFDDFYRDGMGLLFYGPVGTGKTFYASCIANALIDKGYPCLVTNFSRIINKYQSAYDDRQDYLDALNRFDLLVIDDLAVERDTDYVNEIVQTIIDARYRVRKPIIVTTNLTPDELTNPDGVRKQRGYSRLYAMTHPIKVDGADRRRSELRDRYANMERLLTGG